MREQICQALGPGATCVNPRGHVDDHRDTHGNGWANPQPEPWTQTFTGRKSFMLAPRPEDICILDVAHHLSQEPRFGGAAKYKMSVAQHCVNLARLGTSRTAKLMRLLHDAPEAYLKDMPRPYKCAPGMREILRPIEERMERAIAARFGLDLLIDEDVSQEDDLLLAHEAVALMRDDHFDDWRPTPKFHHALYVAGVDVSYWPDELAELKFLQEFIRLTEGK